MKLPSPQWQRTELVYKVSGKKSETPVGKDHLVWCLGLQTGHREQSDREEVPPSSREADFLLGAFKLVSNEKLGIPQGRSSDLFSEISYK